MDNHPTPLTAKLRDMKGNCKHEEAELVGVINSQQTCIKCGTGLIMQELSDYLQSELRERQEKYAGIVDVDQRQEVEQGHKKTSERYFTYTYNGEYGSEYIRIGQKRPINHSYTVREGLIIDFDSFGNVVGVEIV